MSPAIQDARNELQQLLETACVVTNQVTDNELAVVVNQLCNAARALANRINVHELSDGDMSEKLIRDSVLNSTRVRTIANRWLINTQLETV